LPGNTGVNPCFDPMKTDHQAAFWIDIRSGVDRVATMAVRYIETPAYYPWVRSGQLWQRLPCSPIDIKISDNGPGGRLAHTGGLWVHPDWRGIGISWLLPRLIRVLALQAWNINYSTGLVFEQLHRTGLAAQNYGAQRIRFLFEGWFPPTGRNERLFGLEYDRPYLLEGVRKDMLLIRNDADQKMRHLAPIAKKGRHEPTIDARDSARLQVDLR
jgi:GNAT superfamily N-acetyltransferase